MIRSRPIRILTAVSAALILSACGASRPQASRPALQPLTLWLDYTPWGAHVPLYVAQSRGYFRRQGLQVAIRVPANLSDPLKLVAHDPHALGIGYMSDVVTAESQGLPVESVAALVQHHLNCIMTLRSSGITSPRQLAGKSIGAAETPADNVILNTVFKHAHVLGKVRRVNVSFDYVPALLHHTVDAIEGGYQVWERVQIEQQGQHVNVIQLQKWGVPDEYELVLLANRTAISHDPSELRRFMTALRMGVRFAVGHPRRAVRIFVHDNPGYAGTRKQALVSRSWHLLIPFVQPPGTPFGRQSAARWAALGGWMYRNHLVSKRVPVRALFTGRFDT